MARVFITLFFKSKHSSLLKLFLVVKTVLRPVLRAAFKCALCKHVCSAAALCDPPGSSVRGVSQARNWSGSPGLLQGLFLTPGPNAHLHGREVLCHGTPGKPRERFAFTEWRMSCSCGSKGRRPSSLPGCRVFSRYLLRCMVLSSLRSVISLELIFHAV